MGQQLRITGQNGGCARAAGLLRRWAGGVGGSCASIQAPGPQASSPAYVDLDDKEHVPGGVLAADGGPLLRRLDRRAHRRVLWCHYARALLHFVTFFQAKFSCLSRSHFHLYPVVVGRGVMCVLGV